MALVNSLDLPLGMKMPDFSLKDPNGRIFRGNELVGPKGLLVVFTCNHCPYAIAQWPRLLRLACDARERGIATVAINPNIHPNYPDDAPEKMIEKISQWQIPFPYLVDAKQEVAKDFQAQCTPDNYLFDADSKLFYHGRMDDNWQDENKVTARDLAVAIDHLASGKNQSIKQVPSMGCSIKWV